MDKFIFWGLFLVLGFIVIGYVLWMYWVERKEKKEE